MHNLSRFTNLCVVVLVASSTPCACVHEAPPTPEVTVQPKPVAAPEPTNEERELVGLRKVVGDNQMLEQHVEDVILILEAREAKAKGNAQLALRKWKQAATSSEGALGRVALEGWIKEFTKSLGKRTERTILAKLLIAELDDGRISTALIEQGLDDEAKMIAALERLTPDSLSGDKPLQASDSEALPAGVPKDDPILLGKLKQICGLDKYRYDWQTWIATLPPDHQMFFKSLAGSCTAVSNPVPLAELHPRLARKKQFALAAEAAARAALAQRRTASRQSAADSYRDLIGYWEKGNPEAKDFGEPVGTFLLRRINDHLWASRYRALIGDYELAKVYAQRALNFVSEAYAQKDAPTNTSFRRELAILRAEGYHILAFRIAVEKKEFQSAASLSKLALETSYLNEEWKDRLGWLVGLYSFLEQNYEGATRQWESLLQQTSDPSTKSSTYFWLAKTYQMTGNKARTSYYVETLLREFPLSYYSVVGLREAGLIDKPLWLDSFGDIAALSEKFRGRTGSYRLDDVRSQRELNRLLLRSEILVSAKLPEWATLATQEFERALRRQFTVKNSESAYVYLSRLHYGAGNYLASIALTSELSGAFPDFWRKWPEQLLVYFPQPFADIYQRNAVDHALDEELLLAVSRQESGFNAGIRSHANAIGLMQLIPATGERFKGGLLEESSSIEQLLLKPEANITIGSRYLKHLNVYYRGFTPAVFGAYNAGEYAVDTWLERRNSDDPLVFIELVPFGETKGYIKNVWRNLEVYRTITRFGPQLAPVQSEMSMHKFAATD